MGYNTFQFTFILTNFTIVQFVHHQNFFLLSRSSTYELIDSLRSSPPENRLLQSYFTRSLEIHRDSRLLYGKVWFKSFLLFPSAKMPNSTQPWYFGGINNLPSAGRLSSNNNAEKAGQLPPSSAGQDTQVSHTENGVGGEDESTLSSATVVSCPVPEGNPRDTASVVKR
jgi:hypothetical protein